MKKRNQVRNNSSAAAATPQSKTHGADGANAQTPEDLLKLVRSHGTWRITSDTTKALHRTLDGQLILADRKPADMSGYIEYTGARLVSYAEACKWIPGSGNRWKPEVLLQFHGITDPARAAAQQSQTGHNNTVNKTGAPAGAIGNPGKLVPPPGGEVGVVIYDWSEDENVGEFNLTATEFSRIRDAIAKAVDRPVDRAAVTDFVRESLLRSASRGLFPGYPLTELDEAVTATKGLIHLMLSYQSSDEAEAGRETNRERISDCFFLCKSIGERLESAFNAVNSYVYGRAA